MRTTACLILVVMAMLWPGSARAQDTPDAAYAMLRRAYAVRDADAAAAAYVVDAELAYQAQGRPDERFAGRAAITASFASLFGSIDRGRSLDLNFRILERRVEGRTATDRGLYRLSVNGRPSGFGAFEARLEHTADGWRFARDISTPSSRDAFERAPGDLLLDRDDAELDRAFYRQLTGRYAAPDGCTWVVTMSVVRLFARDTCTQRWVGLYRRDGLTWGGGDTVLSTDQNVTFRFSDVVDGAARRLTVEGSGRRQSAERVAPYRIEPVAFTSDDGAQLAGDLYLPSSPGRHPATILVHGSGPQNRDGYASIIAVLADALAASGHVVLSYDKRGVGGSGGEDWSRADFQRLAGDAVAGISFLRSRDEVDPARVGVAGSSQAGWVAARLVASGGRAAHVFMLGAAGGALTVVEQNLYNTGVRMRCAGIPDDQVALALDQQRAFFDALADPSAASRLDAVTARARTHPALADWLFPDSTGLASNDAQWFTTLEVRFDPLPVWREYQGRALFVFSSDDDSTPSRIAAARLAALRRHQIVVMENAQHLGLVSDDLCRSELSQLSRFAPDLFVRIATFARETAP